MSASLPSSLRISCRACGAEPAPGTRHRKCSACQTMRYCDRACQAKHYAVHQATCAELVAMRSAAQFRRIMRWYTGIPQLGRFVGCLAWMNRREGGVVRVQGGKEWRTLEKVSVLRRPDWGEIGESEEFAQRFGQEDFCPDRHYFVMLEPFSESSEKPVVTPDDLSGPARGDGGVGGRLGRTAPALGSGWRVVVRA